MTEDEAALLVWVAERYLRYRARDGKSEGEDVRRMFAAAAREVPTIASRCPALLRFTRLQPRPVGAGQSPERDKWYTPEQAALILGLRPDSVRAQLRRGRLTGRRTERGWQVDRRSVDTYRRQRAA